jgi:hypothetical protein
MMNYNHNTIDDILELLMYILKDKQDKKLGEIVFHSIY